MRSFEHLLKVKQNIFQQQNKPLLTIKTLWFLISFFLWFDLDFNLIKETYINIYEAKKKVRTLYQKLYRHLASPIFKISITTTD